MTTPLTPELLAELRAKADKILDTSVMTEDYRDSTEPEVILALLDRIAELEVEE
jgi:hypothetical protein